MKYGRHRHLSEKDIDTIRKLKERGVNYRDIMERYGISKSMVYYALNKMGEQSKEEQEE